MTKTMTKKNMTPEQIISQEVEALVKEICTSKEAEVKRVFHVHKFPFNSFWNGMRQLYEVFRQFDVEGFQITTRYEDSDIGTVMVTVEVTMPLVWNQKKV